MPENAQSQNDRPLEAPSLLELSAEIVANHAENLLNLSKQNLSCCTSSTFLQPSSSKYNGNDSKNLHGVSRVVGLRDQAAEQALIQHQTAANKPNHTDGNPNQGLLPVHASELVLRKICEKWRQQENSLSPEEIDNGIQIFYDGNQCPIATLDFSNLQITDRILAALLVNQSQTLTALSLVSTKGITSTGLCSLLQKSKVRLTNLRSLKLNSTDLLRVPKKRRYHPYVPAVESVGLERALNGLINMPPHIDNEDRRMAARHRMINDSLGSELLEDAELGEEKLRAIVEHDEAQIELPPQFLHFCPELEHLYLIQGLGYNIEDEVRAAFLVRILLELGNLKTLDLSEWILSDFTSLQRLQNLECLVLYDVHNLEGSIDVFASLTSLRSLDVSQSDRATSGLYSQPVTALHKLVVSLPNLQYLDISGTNLTASPSENDRPFRGTGTVNSDIAGLSFLHKPLKYLGIFNCDISSQYKNIPAEKICGDHGENQILNAMEMYLERPRTMQSVLNESYQLYRFGTNLHRHVEALHLVLRALSLHLANGNLQIAGSASMFYIIRNVRMNWNTKRHVILALLDGMENHIDEQVMVRNCCLSLCQFDIPQDILFNYGRVANLLVKVLETHHSDALTQRIVVFLLNSMACHVEGEQKIEVGEIGAIEIILQQITRKLQANVCDDVMEVGWSFLWNITDETPANCERFLKAEGLSLFNRCYLKFYTQLELVRNMMGLIGNIAEVFDLRIQLMQTDYLKIFCGLLTNLDEGIEISYNSAGVLAHLVSDGDERWNSSEVELSRQSVSDFIVQATDKWNLDARRFINYRSFKPILRLLPQWHAAGSQQWAVWALANLTTTDKEKYCRFVVEEGGVELLEDLATDARTTDRIRNLAKIVLNNIDEWQKNVEVNIADLEMIE